jgi:hypothetical protein
MGGINAHNATQHTTSFSDKDTLWVLNQCKHEAVDALKKALPAHSKYVPKASMFHSPHLQQVCVHMVAVAELLQQHWVTRVQQHTGLQVRKSKSSSTGLSRQDDMEQHHG